MQVVPTNKKKCCRYSRAKAESTGTHCGSTLKGNYISQNYRTYCFSDSAYRQAISHPSLAWWGAAAALDLQYWTVSPCFPPLSSSALPRDYTPVFKCKATFVPQKCSHYRDGAQLALDAPHKYSSSREKFLPKSAREPPDAKMPPLLTAGCGQGFWLTWAGMRSFLLLLVCLPDCDLWLFIVSLVFFFFPAGKKLLQQQRPAMRLLSCNGVSLPCVNTDFLHYHVQSVWPFSASVTLPMLQRCREEKYLLNIMTLPVTTAIRACWKAQFMANSKSEKRPWHKWSHPSPAIQFQQQRFSHSSRADIPLCILPCSDLW